MWNWKPLTRKLTSIPVGDPRRERERKREREERNIEKERALVFLFRPYMRGPLSKRKF